MQEFDDKRGDRVLRGKIAVVTGASRGGGRGIALALGEAGATVYVTGRSVRGASTRPDFPELTIERTAELVTERGGVGIAVRADATVDAEVEAVFEQVRREQGRVDLLVNNAWGGYEGIETIGLLNPFWAQPMDRWDRMFAAGVRSHLLATRLALPLLEAAGAALVVNTTTEANLDEPIYAVRSFYYLAKITKNEMVCAMAVDFREHGKPITVVALAPGWMHTEVMDLTPEQAAATQSTEYLGRAVVALARDPDVAAKSGRLLRVSDMAREYGFTDVDGRQP